MKIKKSQQDAVSLFEKFVGQLAAMLPTKTKPFFMSLILGALLAIARRRTVTQWLRAAQISDDYRLAFYHMPTIGCNGDEIFNALHKIVLERLGPVIATASKIRFVLDDSPTKRYGRKIEGAGYHHNPTPGRTNAKSCGSQCSLVSAIVGSLPCWS